MRILVTGAGGMLGRDLVTVLRARPDRSVTAAARADLDVTDAEAVRDAVAGHDVVVNAAAWTDVDGAETRERDAIAVNGDAVAHLARACAATGARLVHVSTDYVFGGDATEPYPEDAPTGPANAYGRSKLAGERAVTRLLPEHGYVVRTAWLYGTHGRNFVTTVLRLADERDRIDVVDDQRGQPTWSYRLAGRLVALADAALAGDAAPGVYHGTAAGETTWYGLARAVFARRGLDPDRVRPTTSDRFPRPAPRPRYSVLGHGRWAAANLPPPRDWHADLTEALADLSGRRPGTPP
ncbi:dTDP-4-dehydrorhamnose reductase [Micromonospora sp. WMMD998]|uniref:dTDP-4-dehydrorhamnose reductase n=1 Tax=Micromonospora sp. WMMD998 TaxID=3016092 RepID=UPI00249B4DE7|nr:dTDP-4-dehydrorhamnose reductase [Micromonospora sp. WMMD998]WFE38723.1 dTDP-4-dehydrorhamnose reductase [Micromonospora sp. WMMD998]